MNILILGSSGLLGQYIYKTLLKINKYNVFHNGLNKKKYNLIYLKNIKKILINNNPNLIINCSGVTDIEKCEIKKKSTKKINCDIIEKIFFLRKKYNLKFNFIQFSTDQVYDSIKKKPNKENDKLKINNEYSKQKLEVENLCKKNNCFIIRTNFFGLSSEKNESFTDWIYKSFISKKTIILFKDVYFNPVRINTLVDIIIKIIILQKYKKKGIYNIGSNNFISKSDFAIYFAKKLKIYNKNYKLAKVNDILKVKRSKKMIMDVKKIEKLLKIKMPTIKEEISIESKLYNNEH
jgi:dTDP-4-dehydrorhamnose reductase